MIIVRFLLLALLVFIVVTVAAFAYLQWWQALIVIVAMIFAFFAGMKLIIRSFLSNIGKAVMAGFELKSKVMQGATANVHSVEAAPEPPPRIIEQDEDDEDDDDEEDEDEDEADEKHEEPRPLAYYRLDVTITPRMPDGPMKMWDVGDLCVVDAKAPPLSLTPDDETDAGEGFHFHEVQIFESGRATPDEQGKYEGAQRLNVLVGVPPELRELKFRYYTEQFGRIILPPPYGQAQLT